MAAYRALFFLVRTAAPVIAIGSPRLRTALRERRASLASFVAWGRANRDRRRPLVLFHAASAGELRQAEPIIRRVRARHPDWQIAITAFSASGLPVARSLPADIGGLLPWDAPGPITTFLDALSPTAIVVTKHDLWPVLTGSASARGIRLGLVAGQVQPSSGRLRWPAIALLQPAYAALQTLGAITAEDAVRLALLGANRDRIGILGDPRYDAVLERLDGAPRPAPDPTTLVAGSTWPRDEAILLAAFDSVRRFHPGARLVLAPHEPSESGFKRIARRAARLGLPQPLRFGAAPADHPLVVVTEVGKLAFLYASGGVAYVGGGFGAKGLHSVLEPAACGVPILVGPRARATPDARRLEAAGALFVLRDDQPVRSLAEQWRGWLEFEEGRVLAGRAARATVEAERGAADRCLALVEELVSEGVEPISAR